MSANRAGVKMVINYFTNLHLFYLSINIYIYLILVPFLCGGGGAAAAAAADGLSIAVIGEVMHRSLPKVQTSRNLSPSEPNTGSDSLKL